jgi:hypothetical protein
LSAEQRLAFQQIETIFFFQDGRRPCPELANMNYNIKNVFTIAQPDQFHLLDQ